MTLALGVLTAVLALIVMMRADLTRAREGKVLAFLALFLLPSLTLWAGASTHMERAKTTEFCLSCHVMEDYGRSLELEDKSYLPASHYLNNRIPRDHACYTCHTNYTMFGDVKSKWRGLRHVYVQYLGTIPKRGEVHLYEPFNNRECLHCHAGARSFLETSAHQKNPDFIDKVSRNELGCVSNGCHDIIHDVTSLDDATFWKAK
ncbi:MAG TPA: NapC/NirT family cytochrome c [Terriglobia bacterium]|nr:NapC/NirT family cytochrome c [Terriglobia bacterium]